MEKIFLAKVKNSDDRDCVKYMEFEGFECGHYFGGLYIEGACFGGFNLDYRDRAIVGTIFSNKDEMIEKEKWSLGYENQPYFDDEAFGDDLLNSESYLELDSGKIVEYAY